MLFVIIVLVLMFIVRLFCVLVCIFVDREVKWSKSEILFMMWVREIGVILVVFCGIILVMKVFGYEVILFVVFMIILIILVI